MHSGDLRCLASSADTVVQYHKQHCPEVTATESKDPHMFTATDAQDRLQAHRYKPQRLLTAHLGMLQV